MNTFFKTSWAWLLLGVAIAVWVGGGWWAYQIDALVSEREAAITKAAEEQAKDVAALRTRALIAETAEDRARLATLSKIDVVEAAKQIESAGMPASVKFHVRDASLEAVPNKQSTPLQPVAFSVDAEGTFVQLIRAIALLRSLPFPVQITQIDLSTNPIDPAKKVAGAPQWHVSLRLRLLTTAPLPS